MRYALVGNQNCGKTTLFNALTGSNQHVGNFPGVTVDAKIGYIKHGDDEIIDLPGIYSIRPYTNEEIVTTEYILKQKPDCIVNIVDAMNIERNLYLTLQLLEMRIPTVIALNMMDELKKNGGSIDVKLLSELIGVPIVPISAIREEGIEDLISKMKQTAENKTIPLIYDFCKPGPIHRCIHAVTHIVEDHAEKMNVSSRFACMQVLLNDEQFIKSLKIDKNELETIGHHILEMENEYGLDVDAAIADMRYSYIEDVCLKTVKKPSRTKESIRSEKIDRILTNKYLALPLFVLIMALVFWFTFGPIGSFFNDLLASLINIISLAVDKWLTNYGINPVVHSLIMEGIFAGVGSVLSFLPTIVILFFFLSVLEDTGYMARVAFVMDKLLRKIGLSGKSIVPLLIGFGCSVPAIMSSRTLSSERDKKMTIFMIPFMSCSAKVPIYALFTTAFFANKRVIIMTGLYFGGIIMSILVALLLNKTFFKGKPIPFILELPNYRLPSAKSVVLLMWDKAKDFIQKAFGIIFVVSIVIWFLENFDSRINVVVDPSESILANIGKLIAPIFAPMGFADWRIATSLITGISAKEAVVGTLGVLLAKGTSGSTASLLKEVFTPASALAFLTFTLLYTPCVASIAALRKELNSRLLTVVIVIFQCGLAWLVSLLVYKVGLLIL